MNLVKEVLCIIAIFTILVFIPLQIIVSPSLEMEDVVEQLS